MARGEHREELERLEAGRRWWNDSGLDRKSAPYRGKLGLWAEGGGINGVRSLTSSSSPPLSLSTRYDLCADGRVWEPDSGRKGVVEEPGR